MWSHTPKQVNSQFKSKIIMAAKNFLNQERTEKKMKNRKQIFFLYSCDVLRRREDMKLLMVTASSSRLRRFIEAKLRNGDMRYADNGESYSEKKAIQQLRADWKTKPRNEINNLLDEGFIDYVYDGEEI